MKILAIGAHYDDIELGCGGTLHKLIQKGHDVFYLGLSDCFIESLHTECLNSLNELGIKKYILSTVPNRTFSQNRQIILDTLIRVREEFMPDVIFTHGSKDFHQDHEIVHKECLRAFKETTMLGYNHPWNTIHSVTHLSVSIDVAKKISILRHYVSQSARKYMQTEYIEAMNFNGEHFEVIKLNENILCVG
jgi:LmbE family N-acetylglucosaminyl deacetylase